MLCIINNIVGILYQYSPPDPLSYYHQEGRGITLSGARPRASAGVIC
jgi:hypothetical protein